MTGRSIADVDLHLRRSSLRLAVSKAKDDMGGLRAERAVIDRLLDERLVLMGVRR